MAKKPGRPFKNVWAGKTGLSLNLGCGDHLEPGYVNIDIAAECDLKLDLEDADFPFDDESCDRIYASQIMEHISPRRFIPLMNECHRVLKKNGQLVIEVPLYPAKECFGDPQHVKVFTQDSFKYFDARDDLYRRHEYGIKPYKLVMQKPKNWNLIAELIK